MGFLRVELGLANPFHPERKTSLEVLVDTGALLSVVPAERLRALDIEPLERRTFKLADGRQIEREVGEVRFHFNGYEGTSKVVFGEKDDAVIMGVLALETLGLEVDPIRGELRPTTLFLFFAGAKKQMAFEVACPHCGAKLTVDSEMHAVLEHVPPPEKSAYDFDEQLKGLSEAERKREEVFRQQMAAEKDRAKLLERKFEESLKKRKDEPVEKPLRPIDLD